MKRSIYFRLLLVYVIYAILAYFLVLTFTQKQTVAVMQKEEAKRLYREATMIASDYASDYYQADISLRDLQKQMEIASDYMDADISIIDTQDRLLLSSSDSSISSKASGANPEYTILADFDISDFGNSYYRVDTFYGRFSVETLTVFSPITINYRNRGYVLISRPVSSIVSSADSFINVTFFSTLIVFGGSLLILFWITWYLCRPLRRIDRSAQAFARGDFANRIELHRNDEIGNLANTLDYMAEQMDQMEDEQRKFISNVSHDFRSPLTSIRGYAQAMLDGTIPPEFQEKYLKVILFETERLTKLTQSLLDLNKFGRQGLSLTIGSFDINDMIRQILPIFEGSCLEKGLNFSLILTGQQLYVKADAEKISQVIHNLIDNAVKFSYRDTTIRIETNVRNEKVFVMVRDSGIGIPADSINKVWDRFYKTDQSRGRDQKGSGLGLAIVKEIISAHNENINVISTEGVGTEFVFSLPLDMKEN